MADERSNIEAVVRSYLGGLAHVHTKLSNYLGHYESDQTVQSYIDFLEAHKLLGEGAPWQYLVVTNHTSNPVRPRRLGKFSLRARELARSRWKTSRSGIPVLYGFEASLLPGGANDLTPRLAQQAMIVIGSAHGGLGGLAGNNLARKELLMQASASPSLDVLGHPIREARGLSALDWAAVFRLARESGTAVEVNLNTYRETFSRPEVRQVWQEWLGTLAKSNAHVFLGYDLHNRFQLNRLLDDWHSLESSGRPNALRDCILDMKSAGITPERVINRKLEEFTQWCRTPKPERAVEPGIVPTLKGPQVPGLVATILRQQRLTVSEVFRNGPRYWVGKVEQDGLEMILKVVLDDRPWRSVHSGEEFRPSDQLLAEAVVLTELEPHHDRLAGRAAVVHRAERTGVIWTLRSTVPGFDVSSDGSTFTYDDGFFTSENARALASYIHSYQALTPKLAQSGLKTPKSHYYRLEVKKGAVRLEDPHPVMAPYAAGIRAYLDQHEVFHDSQPLVLAHGEVYPPHLFYYDGQFGLIDWENAHRNNRMTDFVAAWIRGYNHPEWQQEFRNIVLDSMPAGARPDMELLWNIEALTSAAGTLHYLASAEVGPAIDTARAIQRLTAQIEEILNA